MFIVVVVVVTYKYAEIETDRERETKLSAMVGVIKILLTNTPTCLG